MKEIIKNLIIKPNSIEEHTVYLEVEVEINCISYEEKEIQVIQDLYCPGERINYDLKTLKSMFFNGMNISSLTSEYCSNIEEELGKIAIEEVEEDMEEILKHFHKLNDQLLDKMYREKAEEIMKCIPMKMEQFYEKFDRECMKVPIFKYYDPFQLFQRISCASNEDRKSVV